MKARKTQIQQGDLFFQKVRSLPAGAEKAEKQTGVFAEGEGHHVHRAATVGDVEIYFKDGVKFARVLAPLTVEHVTPDGRPGEHYSVSLEPGVYQFGQVVEYDYLAEMAREVVD